MPRKTLFMETTSISPQKTVGEIMEVLTDAGAKQIATDFECGKISALRWVMEVNGTDMVFRLPARYEAVYEKLLATTGPRSRNRNESLDALRKQAERVAWRQLYRWVLAQMALISTGMVTPGEVFLPYALVGASNRTLWETYNASGFTLKQLTSGR